MSKYQVVKEWVLAYYKKPESEIFGTEIGKASWADIDAGANVDDAVVYALAAHCVDHFTAQQQAEIDALKAQVSKHVESQRLRSIDCAPTDKTVLLLRMGTTMCASGIFDGYTGYWMWPHDAMPTHWQELPETLAKARGESCK